MNLKMSKGLRWALAATVLATAVAAWLPETDAPPAAETLLPRATATSAATPAATPAAPRAARPAASAPAAWPAPPARRLASLPPPRATALAAWADTGAATPAAPKAAPAAAPVAAAPVEPPPPYTLIGLVEEAGGVRALLLAGQKTLVVGVGDKLDERWQVESIAARSVTLARSEGTGRHVLSFKPA